MKIMNVASFAILGIACLFNGCGKNDIADFVGSGTLEADEVLVSSLLAGRVDTVAVSQGDQVRAGQLIARIDVRKLNARLRQSQASLEELLISRRIAQSSVKQAEDSFNNIAAKFKRQQNLLKSGSSTQQIVDDLSTQVALARSQLTVAKDQLMVLEAKQDQVEATIDLVQLQIADGSVLSPLTGTIIETYVESGENVAPGSPVVKIVNMDEMWLRIYVSEQDVGSVKLDAELKIMVDALPEETFEGYVTWVSPRAEFTPRNIQTREARADLVFAVKVEFKNPDHSALIGMPADVVLP